jgi:hypothetical protein
VFNARIPFVKRVIGSSLQGAAQATPAAHQIWPWINVEMPGRVVA